MKTTHPRRVRRAALFAVSTVSVAAAALGANASSAVASPASGGANPIVRIDDSLVRGADVAGVNTFLGLPYAAPPTGNLRWRAPQPTANNPYLPPGPISEDCLYLNVYTPTLSDRPLTGQPDRHPDHLLVHIDPGHLRMDDLHGQPPCFPRYWIKARAARGARDKIKIL